MPKKNIYVKILWWLYFNIFFVFQIKNIKIQNFRNIEKEIIDLWPNKTVFVWKNGSWKTIILKAIEKLFNSKKIKEKDFKNIKLPLILESEIIYNGKTIFLKIESIFDWKKVKINKEKKKKDLSEIEKKLNVVYIPWDRKINKNNKENGYVKLVDLILKNKESIDLKNIKKIELTKINDNYLLDWENKTTLLITLLRLYIYSLINTNNDNFNIFLIDQPENFLHPHATKMIDELLQKIGELKNTQILYSTHSWELVSNFRKWKYEISDIVFVKNISWNTTIKKIDNKYGRFNKIMINLIFKNSWIFFSDWVILVEWETEKISIPNIYENVKLWKYIDMDYKDLSKEEIENYFNLNAKNISVIDVWWKWALHEWYEFSCELFWTNKVFAIIDKDSNYEIDYEKISRSIKRVYGIENVLENDFIKYNWIILDWEFENYYKKSSIKNFLKAKIDRRKEKYWKDFDPIKYEYSIKSLNYQIKKLYTAKKISSEYEKLFNIYFYKYSKPTIAFNLSIWLTQNNWFDERLYKIFAEIIIKMWKIQ